MDDFEKLGVFYLGSPYDLKERKRKDGLLLYDSKDLVTHAVCVGMTGSGKTGLCISLLEEAAIDGIPSIVIDPKGDLPNLLLTFPQLKSDDFLPWVNPDDAQKKNLSTAEYAAQQADLWKKGLAEWHQDGSRIQRLRDAAEFRIYTPGSNAGIPISILKSFAAPPAAIREDAELLAERVNTTVTSLLGLIGIDAHPIQSREHILISNILTKQWITGLDLDVATLIQQIQSPPLTKIGVMNIDSFFPASERFQLAMALNNLLAAPSFASWMEGEALDIQQILYSSLGRPRVAIFSIAHLDEAQRMFFVSLLLNQVLGWTRTQSGTTSLRAILYMDEIFGYFPPVSNPPSKLPLLTLLKQGRAFGLGVVLATQNPVDLDYKGLSNTGTWFIGRLQTERDKARVLEGLEGAAAGEAHKFDRQQMEQILAGLSSRVFVLNNTHDDAPEVFETRWAMSYLRGPLTRVQIKELMDPIKPELETTDPAPATDAGPAVSSPKSFACKSGDQRPVLPPAVPQYFLPASSSGNANQFTYAPMILGAAEIHYSDSKTIDVTQKVTLLGAISDEPVPLDWGGALLTDLAVEDLKTDAVPNSEFSHVPSVASKIKNYEKWGKELATWLYRNHRLELFQSPSLKIVSNPGESERDFRVRLQQTAREHRDMAVDKLRQRYAPKIAKLEEKRRRAEQITEREAEQAKTQKYQTAISFGTTLLSSFLGRKAVSLTTLGRATTAARGVSRSMKEANDVARAQEIVAAVNEQLIELDGQFKAEAASLERSIDPLTEVLEKVSVRPKKTDIGIKLVTLAWAPFWNEVDGPKRAW